MSAPGQLEEELLALEGDADRIFGEDSKPMRTIIGIGVAFLEQRAGLSATRGYIERALSLIRRLDPTTDSPLADKPPAS